MKATFSNSVDVLVKAYLNDTLAHGKCSACAVGNLIGSSMNTSYLKSPFEKSGISYNMFKNGYVVRWDEVFKTDETKEQVFFPDNLNAYIQKEIDMTGYSLRDLMRIEYAFEVAERNCLYEDYKNQEWMFNGLMAVVDVLADIHQIDLSVREEAKLMFVK